MQRLMNIVLDIGSQMLISGAEVSRVEDTVTRICRAYGVAETNVFTITSTIILTIKDKNGDTFTQTKRITYYETNLDRLDRLNSLSRYICANIPDFDYAEEQIKKINKSERYSSVIITLVYALIAASLTLFSGGDLWDFFASGIIGGLLKMVLNNIQSLNNNSVFVNMVTAFITGCLIVFCVYIGFGHNIDKIVIGNIMLMIPGVALTNSIRDMINGDTMSGMLRFIEAIVGAVAVSVGFVLATVYIGGVLL